MSFKSRRKLRIVKLIRALEAGGSLAAVLDQCCMTPRAALRDLRHPDAGPLLRMFAHLQRLQKRLILQRSGPQAVAAMSRHIGNDDKPELQLKSAISLLQLAAARAKSRAAPKPRPAAKPRPLPPPEDPPEISENEARALLVVSAATLHDQDTQRFAS